MKYVRVCVRAHTLEVESESSVALSQGMLHCVLLALACCFAFTLDSECLCARVKKIQVRERQSCMKTLTPIVIKDPHFDRI